MIHFGKFGGYKILVMTKVGATLLDLTNTKENHKLPINTICKITLEAVSKNIQIYRFKSSFI